MTLVLPLLLLLLKVLGALLLLGTGVVVAALLTGDAIECQHDYVDIAKPDMAPLSIRYRVKLNHWLPRSLSWIQATLRLKSSTLAITLFGQILVTGARCWPELHAHEFRHIAAFVIYKLLMVYYTVRDFVTLGYAKSRIERDAEQYAWVNAKYFDDINPGAVTS